MLSKRRPARGRTRSARRVKRDINFPQLRKEVMLMSKMGLILNQSDFFQENKVFNAVGSDLGIYCQ